MTPRAGPGVPRRGSATGEEHPIHAAEREILEEAGIRACVTGFLGIWVGVYGDDPSDEGADLVRVAYYHA